MVNLVLDLDETLIHTLNISRQYVKELDQKADFYFQIDGQYYWVTKRPGLDMFLDFLFKYFKIGIWTAADKEYAKQICKNILNYDQLKKIRFIYSRNFCHLSQDQAPVAFTKPLSKLYDIYTDMNESNTLMFDNSPTVMRYNVRNGVNIPDFTSQSDDEFLYHLRNIIIKYYQKVPINTPVWGLVSELNKYTSSQK